MTKYVVTGACVTHVPAAGPDGQMLVTLYQGAQLPEGVPEDRVKHLLDNNLIAKADSDEAEEAILESYAPNKGDQGPAEPKQDPASKPVNGRSSKDDLVAHAVANGMNEEDAKAMSRDDLLNMYVRK